MNISEVEKLTGITKQSIRFYEKEGLLCPVRNDKNGYREYEAEEVRRLKFIYILRKIGIPVSEIKKVLDGELTLAAAVTTQQEKILKQREQQDAILRFCDEIKPQSLERIDVDRYKEDIENEERCGNKFFDFLDEYQKVYWGEAKKKFTIYPDDIVMTSQEFTNALLKYAKEMNGDITIIKEGMYPEFIYNGVEYKAHRVIAGIAGTPIICRMKHPEMAEPTGIEGHRKVLFQIIANYFPLLFGVLFVLSLHIADYGTKSSILIPLLGGLFVLVTWIPYWKKR